MSRKTPLARNRKMRSSPESRRLIRAYIKFYGSEREAAKHLSMTQGQLNGIKSGRLRDTAAMKIALDRADARARRAWAKLDRTENGMTINAPATLRAIKRNLVQTLIMIDVILSQCD